MTDLDTQVQLLRKQVKWLRRITMLMLLILASFFLVATTSPEPQPSEFRVRDPDSQAAIALKLSDRGLPVLEITDPDGHVRVILGQWERPAPGADHDSQMMERTLSSQQAQLAFLRPDGTIQSRLLGTGTVAELYLSDSQWKGALSLGAWTTGTCIQPHSPENPFVVLLNTRAHELRQRLFGATTIINEAHDDQMMAYLIRSGACSGSVGGNATLHSGAQSTQQPRNGTAKQEP
ncbi:MAG: hypothetical protein ACOC95_06750 [Planctomycetota bacterium]